MSEQPDFLRHPFFRALRAMGSNFPRSIGVGAMTLTGIVVLLAVPAALRIPTRTRALEAQSAPTSAPTSAVPRADVIAPPFHVLFLDGADPARPAAQELLREFAARLNQGNGRRVEIFEENLDRRRFDDPAHLQGAQDWYREKYRNIRIDAIVSIEDVPAAAAVRLRAAFGYDVPIIAAFTSARAERATTAIREQPAVSIVRAGDLEGELIRHISALFPETRSIAVVADRSEAVTHLTETIQRVSGGSIASRPLSQLPMSALRDSLAALPDDAVVLYWSISRDGDGNTWIPSEALRAVASASARPIFGTVDLLVGMGSFGGPSLSYGAVGRDLADQTRAVLQEAPGAVNAEITHDAWRWSYDWPLVQRFGIREARLHAPAEFVGRPVPFWVSHPVQTGVGSLLLLMQLLSILILMRRNRALSHARSDLRTMSEDLIRAQDDERARIARDLQDDLCQQMSLLAIEMGGAPQRETVAFATKVHRLVRRTEEIARGLHPGTVAMQDLRHAVESLAHPIGAAHGIAIEIQSREWPTALSDPTTLGLFRIIQEALQNVARHAGAQRCSIQFTRSDALLKVVVKDDGVGMAQGDTPLRGLGLRSMQERARALGGNVYLSSEPLRGTSVVVLLPYSGS